MILRAICISVLVPLSTLAQKAPPELTPTVARLARTFDRAPDGQEFFEVRLATIEPMTGALWIKYGPESDPPVRIDRKSGVGKVIGRKGSGPNEYERIIAMQPGPNGQVGIWDPARRLWLWVDSSGGQRRTWSAPMGSLTYRVFTDRSGRVYIGQPAIAGSLTGGTVLVRLDSAKGLRDTTALPLREVLRGSWSYNTTGGSASTQVMFSPRVEWGVDRGGRIYAAWTDSNYVLVRDGKGEQRRWLPNWKETVNAADRKRANDALDMFEAQARQRSAALAGPRPSVPAFKPQITSVMPEMNGGLLIRRTRACANFPAWRAPITGTEAVADTARCAVVERFDQAGRRLAPFTLLTGDQLMVMRADTAWVARTDADGLTKILELVIPRR